MTCCDCERRHRRLTPKTQPLVLELAQAPDGIRGYEDIKLANVARYRDHVADVLARLDVAGQLTHADH